MQTVAEAIDILCDVSYKAHKISFTEKVSLFVKDNFSFTATLSNEHVIVRTDVNGQNPYPSSMDKAKTTVYAYKGTTLLAAVSSKTALTKGTFYCESDINLSKLSADTFKLTQAAIAVDLEENSSIIKVYIESETNIFDRIFSWSKQRDAVAGEKGDQGDQGIQGIPGPALVQVKVLSDNGDMFLRQDISARLTAYVYDGDTDVTANYTDEKFHWSKYDKDGTLDEAWNTLNHYTGRFILITSNDIQTRAIFSCSVDKI